MAVPLSSKPNTTPPAGDFPYGDIRDNPGNGSGTPVNRAVYGDFHQFFAKLLDKGGVFPNGLPENLSNGYQYITALGTVILNTVRNDLVATTLVAGITRLATLAEVIAGTAVNIAVTPGALINWFNSIFNQPWTLRSNTSDVVVAGGSGTAVGSSSIVYQVIGKTMDIQGAFTVSNTTAPSQFSVLIPAGKSNGAPISAYVGTTILNGGSGVVTDGVEGYIDSATSRIVIVPGTLTNTNTTTVRYSVRFQIA